MESSECSSSQSLPQQRSHSGQTANRSSSSSRSSEQDYLPFPAVFGSDLEHSLDHKSAENLFSDIQFSPHASEYSIVDPTTPEQFQSSLSPFTMDTLFSTNSTKVVPSLCANCYAHTKPQFLPQQDLGATVISSTNTTTRPLSQHGDHDPARASGVRSKIWTTPLHISATHGHLWAVRLLLDHGADPNAIDGAGSTVLHTAVQRGHHDIVRELLRYNADPSSVDRLGWLPLHYAAEAGDENCMRALLQTGGGRN